VPNESDHFADDGARFAGGVRSGAHAPKAMEHDAGDGVHHGGESGDGEHVASNFNSAFFRGAFDFLGALEVGHRADVPDVKKNFTRLREEEAGKFAIVRPSPDDSAFIDGSGFGVEKKRELRDISLGAIHTNVALALLFGIVERVRMEKRPDELAANVLHSEFEVRVLIDGVMAAEKSSRPDIEALFVVDFFWAN